MVPSMFWVYTFVTADPTYPAAYVDGEIYCFHPTLPSVGSDYFQVNALGPKPISKRTAPGSGGFTLILPQDIQATGPVTMIYLAFLHSGTGGFILINPFFPLYGDGLGGVQTSDNLTVLNGDLHLGRTDQTYGFVTRPGAHPNLGFATNGGGQLNDVNVNAATMEVTGKLSATGYSSRSGLAGPYQAHVFNIQWTTSSTAHLWIDTTDLGPILIGAGGTITGNVTVIGDLAAHTITATGGMVVSAGGLDVQGGGATIEGDLSAHTINLSGGLVVAAGGVNIESGGLNVVGTAGFGNDVGITGVLNLYAPGSSNRVFSTSLGVPHFYVIPGQLDALIVEAGVTDAGRADRQGDVAITATDRYGRTR
jgi:hypothetical protein